MLECTLKQMEVFHAVMNRGTVGEAADLLGMTQPAASQALAEWEKRTGGFCFDRIGRRLVPNERGRSLFDGVSRVLASTRDLEQAIAGRSSWQLRLAAGPVAANHLLPARLGRLRARHPAMDLQVESLPDTAAIQAVLEGRADCAFISSAYVHPALKVEIWHTESMVLLCPANHPAAGRELGETALLALAAENWLSIASEPENHRLYCPSARPGVVVPGPDAACRAVASGAGLAVLSRDALGESSGLGQIRPDGALPRRQACVAYPASHDLPPELRAVLFT